MSFVELPSRPTDAAPATHQHAKKFGPGRRLAFTSLAIESSAIVALLAGTGSASAHGFAGPRFFPATIATDDPFIADEMSLPTVSTQKTSTEPAVKETDVTADFAKRITPGFGFVMGTGWTHLDQSGDAHNPNGFQNFHITPQYQLFVNGPHEAIGMIGVISEIGTGARRIGADQFQTFTPTFYFGKGAGDLPESLDWVRPFALTGTLGYAISSRGKSSSLVIDPDSGIGSLAFDHHSNKIATGAAVEYSMPYLSANVYDLGLPRWVNQLIPLVEFSFTTPVTDRYGERTVGTINPGIIWSGTFLQFGIEAIIPATKASGKNVGILAQLHFYLDDMFPRSVIGTPLFGK